MYKTKLTVFITLMVILNLFSQTVRANNNVFITKYINENTAYALEDKYISEEIRFDIPYALTKYNVVRTKNGGFLFVHTNNNTISCVLYDREGNTVFGNPIGNNNYVQIPGALIQNKYNLGDMGEYDLTSITITEDENYFYLPVIIHAEKYTIATVRFSLADGAYDTAYLNKIYEMDAQPCYSFGAVQARDDNGRAIIVINVDQYIYENESIAGRRHEIHIADKDGSRLVYSDEVLNHNLASGALLRKKAVSHQAVYYDGKVFFTEGIKYEKYMEAGFETKCVIYKLGENTTTFNVNSLADSAHSLENGEYYSVNMLPTEDGLGCIFNYCDIQHEESNIYTYYSVVTCLSYTDFGIGFKNYYIESEAIETGTGQKVKYQNYVDLLLIDGKMTMIWEIREPSEDVIFLGDILDTVLITFNSDGTKAGELIRRTYLENGEIKYGNTYMSDKLYMFDKVPEYDKYTQTLPDNTVISFVSMGYGNAFTATGLNKIQAYGLKGIDVLNGITVKNYLNEVITEGIYAEYNGQRLSDGKFTPDKEGEYEITVTVPDEEGRLFKFIRKVKINEAPTENPPTHDVLFLMLPVLIILTVALIILKRRGVTCGTDDNS